MRRRPQRLQVSTFPFLAVLLGAMGALIFLLLVFDRRAKLAARQKVGQAQAVLQAERDKRAAEQRVESERKRLDFRAGLERQEAELRRQIDMMENQIHLTEDRVRREQNLLQALNQRLLEEKAVLLKDRQELAKQAGLGQPSLQAKTAQDEVVRLTRELAQLEEALRRLQAVRQAEQQVYSLVPYHGRRGDNRQPLYLECTEAGILFHPDRLVLKGSDFSGLAVRREAERRLAELRRADVPQSAAKSEAYLLFLIRPGGIRTYYRAHDALDGLKLDFGYELIEGDWVLDFSKQGTGVRNQESAVRSQGPGDSGQGSRPRTEEKSAGGSSPTAGDGPRRSVPTASASAAEPWKRGGGSAPGAAGSGEGPPAESSTESPNPLASKQSQTARPVSPLSRLLGNRDLIIIVECTAAAVTVPATGDEHSASALQAPAQGEHPLVMAIRQLIARRQATVRPGEPPYRPTIRFRIHPDGLRTYYFAYPLLEDLRLLMVRENLD
jgi:hypothetical protein